MAVTAARVVPVWVLAAVAMVAMADRLRQLGPRADLLMAEWAVLVEIPRFSTAAMAEWAEMQPCLVTEWQMSRRHMVRPALVV